MNPLKTTNFTPGVLRKTRFAQGIGGEAPREGDRARDVHACSSLRPWRSRQTNRPAWRARHLALSWRASCWFSFSARRTTCMSFRSSHNISASFLWKIAKRIRAQLPFLIQISAPHPVLCPQIRKREHTLILPAHLDVHRPDFFGESLSGFIEGEMFQCLPNRTGRARRADRLLQALLCTAGASCAYHCTAVFAASAITVHVRLAQNSVIAWRLWWKELKQDSRQNCWAWSGKSYTFVF